MKTLQKHDKVYIDKNALKNKPKTNINKIAQNISIFNITVNLFLFCIKYLIGIIGNSSSLKADSFHSLSDVLVSILVLIGIKISNKKPDKKMPYGYDRVACIVAIILSFILFSVGSLIGYNSFIDLINKTYKTSYSPKLIALIVSILSILIKIFMFFITSFIAKKTKLDALKADAWHQLSDAFSSIGVFIGIIGTILSINYADKIASILIGIIIIKVSVQIFVDASKKLIDHSAPESIISKIENIINSNCFNINLHISKIKTRLFGSQIYVEIEILLNDIYSFNNINSYCNNLSNYLKNSIPEIKNSIISINFS